MMRRVVPFLALIVLLLAACRSFDMPSPDHARHIVQPPPPGSLYHGVFPGSTSGWEDDITSDGLRQYEQLTGKGLAWVYFSHEWSHGRAFPAATAGLIRDAGSIPFIRLMMRSDTRHWRAESTYTLLHTIGGEFDDDLRTWFQDAKRFGSPLMVEYGTEVNGEWFSWNGAWNGGGTTGGYGDSEEPDGPELFRDAYRHIIALSREEGAENILWVFHVNCGDAPAEHWNRLEAYYPGDNWIDWLGVSLYGAQKPTDGAWPRFEDLMTKVYPRLTTLAPGKPIVLCEFGATRGNPLGNQEAWANGALDLLTQSTWPHVIGFSWWNEGWRNDTDSLHNTDMRIENNPALAKVFHEQVGMNPRILGRVKFGSGAAP